MHTMFTPSLRRSPFSLRANARGARQAGGECTEEATLTQQAAATGVGRDGGEVGGAAAEKVLELAIEDPSETDAIRWFEENGYLK